MAWTRILTLALMLGAALPALADEAEDTLLTLMTEGPDAVTFTEHFREQVSEATLKRVLDRFGGDIGPVTDVRLGGTTGEILSATHRLPVTFALDDEGRIKLLRFEAPQRMEADLPGALARLDALGAEVAYLVLRDGERLAGQRAGDPLAVASAFKLGVLRALVDLIDSGSRDWADVVRIESRHRSLPTGRMQDFPEGAPVTLHTAALAMIAESDNTATDLLIEVAGRDAVAAALGIPAERLLTTREMFALKLDAARAAAWRDATGQDKPALAAEAAATVPLDAMALGPLQEGLEWYLPLDRLCTLIDALGELPLMQVNPGVIARGDPRWQGAAFKGGSEGGVVNLTFSATDTRGRRHCAALTVNDPDIDETSAVLAFSELLNTLVRLP
ncbi:serine hydrolase [Salipiger sp.]|uniref:serine hydrolase n=1 Tax=Salipiger sp. TaxID=2078585 RepID=UPI003A96B8E0